MAVTDYEDLPWDRRVDVECVCCPTEDEDPNDDRATKKWAEVGPISREACASTTTPLRSNWVHADGGWHPGEIAARRRRDGRWEAFVRYTVIPSQGFREGRIGWFDYDDLRPVDPDET